MEIQIIPYSSEYKEAIKTLNVEWLAKYFSIEPIDEVVLSDPEGQILNKGGMIFYAMYNEKIIGTASLLKIDENTFELGKMAVTQNVQGLGIGQLLLEHSINVAKENQIQKIILYSNTKLESAIHLYKKFGFTTIPLNDTIYKRSDIKMEKIIM